MKIIPGEFVFASKEEAEHVLERMNNIIKLYKVTYVEDLKDLVGIPTTYIDDRWGWNNLLEVKIKKNRKGYLINFPPAKLIE